MEEPVSELICFCVCLFFFLYHFNSFRWDCFTIFNLDANFVFRLRHRNAQIIPRKKVRSKRDIVKTDIIFCMIFKCRSRYLMENVLTLSIICDWMQHAVRLPKYESQILMLSRLSVWKTVFGTFWHVQRPNAAQTYTPQTHTRNNTATVLRTPLNLFLAWIKQKSHKNSFARIFSCLFFSPFYSLSRRPLEALIDRMFEWFFPRVQFHLLSDAIQHTRTILPFPIPFVFISFILFFRSFALSFWPQSHTLRCPLAHLHTHTHTWPQFSEKISVLCVLTAHRLLAHKATKHTQRRQLISFLPWQTSAKWINYVHIFHFPCHLRPTAHHHYPIQRQIMAYERSGEKRRMQENCSFYF